MSILKIFNKMLYNINTAHLPHHVQIRSLWFFPGSCAQPLLSGTRHKTWSNLKDRWMWIQFFYFFRTFVCLYFFRLLVSQLSPLIAATVGLFCHSVIAAGGWYHAKKWRQCIFRLQWVISHHLVIKTWHIEGRNDIWSWSYQLLQANKK